MHKFLTMRHVLAAVASASVMFMLAGLWNLLIFPQLGISFSPGILREAPIFPLLILGYLILAKTLVFVGINSNFSRNHRRHWVIVGILVMEIAFGFSSLVLQANYNFPLIAIPLDLIWYLIEGAAGGFVASLFLRK